MSITWFIITALGTLAVSWFYRHTPLHDNGSAIWHTDSPERERVAVLVFRKHASRWTKNISSNAVARTLFLGVIDIVNRTLDANLRGKIWGKHAGRAFKAHQPFKTAGEIAADYNADREPGNEIAKIIYDPDPDVSPGYMAFVIVKDQGWMYIVRRHAFLMMITQMRHMRQQNKQQPVTA